MAGVKDAVDVKDAVVVVVAVVVVTTPFLVSRLRPTRLLSSTPSINANPLGNTFGQHGSDISCRRAKWRRGLTEEGLKKEGQTKEGLTMDSIRTIKPSTLGINTTINHLLWR